MTIDKASGLSGLLCDQCGSGFEKLTIAGEENILRGDARRAGWRRFEKHGQWQDSCPDCVRNFANGPDGYKKMGSLF